jgi:hypothetical protein
MLAFSNTNSDFWRLPMNGKRRIAVAGFQLALGGMLSCSASDPNTIIGGGGGGSGSGNTAGAAASGAGASSTPGGAPSTSAGAGGAPVESGAGAGGAPISGGAPPAAGSGGASTAGSGGTTPAGGSAGASAGAPSTSICTPSGNQFDCNNVLSGMDGYANKDAANGPSQGSDAIQLNCQNSEAAPVIFKQQHWHLTGPGIDNAKSYKVDLHFYGVVECKSYIGGAGPASTDSELVSTTVNHNLWMKGAKDNADHWNTYAFTVTPQSSSAFAGIGPQTMLPDPASTYVLNMCPGTKPEGHFTYRIDYAASITVPGGSYINYIEYDTNCRMITNCGAADASQSCNGPFNIVQSVTQAVPNTNATFMQPMQNTANPPSGGQWWLVDVTGVTAM